MNRAIDLIARERVRQVLLEGYAPEHDDAHVDGEIAQAAAMYALPEEEREMVPEGDGYAPGLWPWNRSAWKPSPDDRIRELVKAGALIVAEIERLQRSAS